MNEEYKRGAIFTFHDTQAEESEEIAMCATPLPALDVLQRVREGADFIHLSGGEATMYAVVGHTLAAFGFEEQMVSLSFVTEGEQTKVRMICRSKEKA